MENEHKPIGTILDSPASESRTGPAASSSRQAKREQARALIRSTIRDGPSEGDDMQVFKYKSGDSKHKSKTKSSTKNQSHNIKAKEESFNCVLCEHKCIDKNDLKKHLESLHVQTGSGKSK